MRKILLLPGLLLIHVLSFGQLSKGGNPPGVEQNTRLADVPLYEMPPVEVARLLAEDSIRELDKTKPIRFGKASLVSIVPAAATGRWQTLPGEKRLWQQRIRSAGAFSISIGFHKMNLPPGSRLFIYNPDHTTILGAFTSELAYTDDILATEQLNGDDIIVEYEVDARYMNVVPFELYRVSHDYRNINKIMQSFGNAGSCQVNIACPVGANYQDVKKGVAAIISSGSELCTGTLINTTNNSGTPYFLTANHCYDNNTANWVFRFNWESPTCANPTTNPAYQSVSGSTLKAKSAATDFCLVQLTTTPPANYNVTYVGWDKSGNTPASQACVSHPSIDIKKICTAATSATTVTFGGAICWQSGTWANGCPEPGSSGSSLLDQNKRIVGQLYGGPSACGEATANMHDYYGKFSLSWTGGGSSTTRLSDWLDPINSNVNTTNLYDPNVTIQALDAVLNNINAPAAAGYCNTSFTPNVTIKNNGTTTITSLTISYKVDNGSTINYSWTGSLASTATINVGLPQFTTTQGSHTFLSYTSQPNGGTDGNRQNDTARVSFTILNTTPQSLPFTESFEGATFPPAGWVVSGPADASTNWKRGTVGYTGTGSTFKNNFDPGDAGEEDNLTSPFLNLPLTTGNYWLSFRVAHAPYTGYNDSLKVAVSADCGATWSIIYRKGSAQLATAQTTTNHFVPTASQWRNDSVSLNAFRNMGNLRIRFINYNDFGNDIYLDDINVTGPVCPGSAIVYVDNARAQSGNGAGWATAFKTLQEGLEAANRCTEVKEIYVAKGTYYPVTGLSRDSSFLITRNGIKIWGGYPTGGGIRNIVANPTILSGEIGSTAVTDNSYHVLLIVAKPGATIDTSTRIDGFTIRGGTANSFTSFQAAGQTMYHDNGGAIYCYGLGADNSCKPTIANCSFLTNYAANRGGAIFNEGYESGNSSPLIVNCVFSDNTAGIAGGSGGTDYGGAAIYNNGQIGNSSPAIINCSFFGNKSNNGVGAVCNFSGSNATIVNCILYGNTSNAGAGNFANTGGATGTVTYSLVQGGNAGTGNINADPLFVNSAAGNFQLQQCSPAINTGNALALPNGTTTDITGAARIFNATVDMGAYECTLLPAIFSFTGAGNWSTVLNWQCNWVPPSPLSAGKEIIINPVGGDCLLNVPFTVGTGGKLTVKTGKKLIVAGNVQLQ